MEQTYRISQKIRQMLVILLPILITQVTMFSMSFFDTVMSGHASAEDLAGVAIGSSIWLPVQAGFSGILLAVTPVVAQYIGAKRYGEVPQTIMQAMYMALALAVVILTGGAFALQPLLQAMDLEPIVRLIAYEYLIAIAFGIPAFLIYTVLRCFMDAQGQTRVTMVITLISLPVNVVLNYVFIFGKYGFPALGGVGAGVATAITYGVICLFAIVVAMRKEPFASYRVFRRRIKLDWLVWRRISYIGIPIGLAIFFETSIFAAVTLLMSEFNTVTIAAHQAAINFVSMMYMVPLSISMGLTILVGFEVGAGRFRDAGQYGRLGIAAAVGVALLFGVVLYLFNGEVASFYTNDQDVWQLTQQFLIYAIFFLLSDAIGAPIQGILRGYKDVNATFVLALISYWIIGLPSGYVLANFTSLGAFGYWIGLISGLAIGAVCLLWRLLHIQRRAIRSAGLTRT